MPCVVRPSMVRRKLLGAVCTQNNDVKGWHHKQNTRGKEKATFLFFLLITLLNSEARNIPFKYVKPVLEGKLEQQQRNQAKSGSGTAYTYNRGHAYNDQQIPTGHLFRKYADIYAPV